MAGAAVPLSNRPGSSPPDEPGPNDVEHPSRRGRGHGHLWHGPGMVRRALHGARRAPVATTVAFGILVVVVGPLLWHRVFAAHSLRLVDLAVYRDAGRSVLMGRPLYSYLTPVPQLLPFTYPPFSSVVAVPLAMLPFGAASIVWTLGTLAVLGWLVVVSFRPFVRRFGPGRRPVVVAVLVSVMAWTLPIRDEFRYGQVGIFLAALCVLDCVLPKTRWPRGMLIGLAIAIKLTPAVFVPYLWLTGRRRAAVVATSWFVGATLAMAIAMPQASRVFWTSALFDSKRVGDNAGTPNQSLRSIFLRSLPVPAAPCSGSPPRQSSLWSDSTSRARHPSRATRFAASRSPACSRCCCRRWRGSTTFPVSYRWSSAVSSVTAEIAGGSYTPSSLRPSSRSSSRGGGPP